MNLAEAETRIRQAWIAGIILGAFKLSVLVYSITAAKVPGAYVLLFDIPLVLGLSYGTYRISRVCSVILFVYPIVNFLAALFLAALDAGTGKQIIGSQTAVLMVFGIPFFRGMRGTFLYYKLTNQQTVGSTDVIPPIIGVASSPGSPDPKWTICTCKNCSGHLEFDASHAGETTQCPHCGIATVLFVAEVPLASPTQTQQPPLKSEGKMSRPWLEPIILLVIAIGMFVGALLYESSGISMIRFFGWRYVVFALIVVSLGLFIYGLGKGIWRIARLAPRLFNKPSDVPVSDGRIPATTAQFPEGKSIAAAQTPLQRRKQIQSAGAFIKSRCRVCEGSIEFPEHGLGEWVDCPHCNSNIQLQKTPLVRRLGIGLRGWFQQLKYNWKWASVILAAALVCGTALLIYADYKVELRKQAEQRAKQEKERNDLQEQQLEALQLANELADPPLTMQEMMAHPNAYLQPGNPSSRELRQRWEKEELERQERLRQKKHQQALDSIKDELERANQLAEDAAFQKRMDHMFPPPAQQSQEWVLKYNPYSGRFQYVPPNAQLRYNYFENRYEWVP